MKNHNHLLIAVMLPLFVLLPSLQGLAQEATQQPVKNRWGLWLQFGLGKGYTKLNTPIYPSSFGAAFTSLNYVRNRIKISLGAVGLGTESWNTGGVSLSTGYNYYDRPLDISLSGGISVSDWSHNIEGVDETISSPASPGFIVRLDGVIHKPQVLGWGFVIITNFSKESSYTALGVFLALGKY